LRRLCRFALLSNGPLILFRAPSDSALRQLGDLFLGIELAREICLSEQQMQLTRKGQRLLAVVQSGGYAVG